MTAQLPSNRCPASAAPGSLTNRPLGGPTAGDRAGGSGLSGLLVTLALTLSAVAPAFGAGRLPPPTRDSQTAAIVQLLRAPHPRIAGADLFRIGPDVQAILIEQATAVRNEPPVRQRALAWLQFFPNRSSRAVLMEALRARGASVATVRVVLRALALGFGVDSLPMLSEHLLHKDLYVREAAALALGDVHDRRVRAVLEDQLGREKELAVRDAIMDSLGRLSDHR